jgi:phytanoyl-CoA hydroxylase
MTLTPEEQAQEAAAANEVASMELEAGEVVLLHNWLLHSSDVNRSSRSRRAFSVCVMDADTRRRDSGDVASESVLFGQGALTAASVKAMHRQR